jgi:hypothetical protein
MIVSLALMRPDDPREISIGPRDVESQLWMMRHPLFFDVPLGTLSRRWLDTAFSDRDMPIAAAMFQRECQARWDAEGYGEGPFEPVTFRVRACRYRVVRTEGELEEM